MSAFLSSLV